MDNQTYSFMDTHVTLSGPGGSIDLSAGTAIAKEGITFEPVDDIDNMVAGADGEIMHSLHASKAAKATIRVLKTSVRNAQLSNLQAYQRQSALYHGQNTISLSNPVTGDSYTCTKVAFARVPSVTWGEDGGIVEWALNIGVMDPMLGGGVNNI